IKLIDKNNPPNILTTLPFNTQQQYYEATLTVGEKFSFDIEGIDADKDFIEITAKSNNSTILSLLGIPSTLIRGFAPQKTTIEFLPSCQLLDAPNFEPKDYFIDLIIRDFNSCNVARKQKTITLRVRVVPSEVKNKPPLIQPTIPNMVGKKVFTDSVMVGETIIFDLIGSDEDNDEISLDGKGINIDLSTLSGITFRPVQGRGLVRTRFAWTPTCENLHDSFGEKTYSFLFTVADKVDCLKLRQDSLTVHLKVYDKPSLPITTFPNAFTPNGDNIGDVFSIKNLPIDNCTDEFVSITIVNRWGEPIFYSQNRNFAWRADGFPSGLYFYVVKYKNKEFKGTINLLKG
ncbi:MAG: gliding motility-associated C-terminal domain-containing protein, partial [Flammeovirgaceae bacterium]|nr:gliding motility-associated C-terminal domain-containing protein [Flammeovirgaceae bacterium]MDW8288937.1 gliding motility-associated C-terminal domain-containing protein [Flammeovirgaceae bacterium]